SSATTASCPQASNQPFDALIIGAGISGLVAAVRLLESRPAARLLVLEAKDRVGGRTLSTALPSSGSGGTDWWDLGGQWVGDCQPRVCQLAEELGISRYQQFNEGRKLLQLADGRVTNYSGELPSIGLLGNLDLAQAIYRFESRLSVSGRSSLVPEAAGSEPASLPELPSDQASEEFALSTLRMREFTLFGVQKKYWVHDSLFTL
uniref:monoamine oxidase n=1 Tax=Macrostomum lignano TaxID=282301 RepID=A0A1I8IRH4_9PLAT